MAKNKKGPFHTGGLSPEKYVRTQARSLPIDECLVTEGWEDAGICNVVIARKHKTGNYTTAIYLIDLYCLGLKDTGYQFNVSPEDFDFLKMDRNWINCEYVLAHNIIYGGIAFAEDYGFKPHKDFAITRFILEEDDEQVELMDIDFGLDGLPCYMRGPYDNDAKVKGIEATLLRTAGPGNYSIMDAPGDFEFDDDDEDDEDFLDDDYNPFLNILEEVSKDYDEFIRTPDVKEILGNSTIGTAYELTGEAIETEYTRFDSQEESQDYARLHQLTFESEDMGEVIEELNEALVKYPGKPLFYNLLLTAYAIDSQLGKADEMVYDMNQLFPGYLFSRVAYANLLMDIDLPGEVLAVFDGKPDLNYLYPNRKVFHKTEAAAFFATMCRYFITADNVDSADLYMNAILKYGLVNMPGQTAVQNAIAELCKLKMAKLKEAGKVDTE